MAYVICRVHEYIAAARWSVGCARRRDFWPMDWHRAADGDAERDSVPGDGAARGRVQLSVRRARLPSQLLIAAQRHAARRARALFFPHARACASKPHPPHASPAPVIGITFKHFFSPITASTGIQYFSIIFQIS